MHTHTHTYTANREIFQSFLAHPAVELLVVNTHVDPELMYSDSLLHDDPTIDREFDRMSHGKRPDLGHILTKYHAGNVFGAVKASEKVIGLPLGIKMKRRVYNKALGFNQTGVKKDRVLVINNSGWGERKVSACVYVCAYIYVCVCMISCLAVQCRIH